MYLSLSHVKDTTWFSAHLSLSVRCRGCISWSWPLCYHLLSVFWPVVGLYNTFHLLLFQKEAHRPFMLGNVFITVECSSVIVTSRPFAEPLETLCNNKGLVQRDFTTWLSWVCMPIGVCAPTLWMSSHFHRRWLKPKKMSCCWGTLDSVVGTSLMFWTLSKLRKEGGIWGMALVLKTLE